MIRLRKALAAGVAGAALVWAGGAAAQSAPPGDPPKAAPDVAPPPNDGLGEGAAPDTPPAAAPIVAPRPAAAPSLAGAIAGGHPILEVRGRYEFVDQTKTAVLKKDAEAYTVRTRLGWETGEWRSLKGLVELENVTPLGREAYAVNVPGATTPPLNGASKAEYPLVNDPKVTELNRLQLTWTPSALASFTLGRQRILIDDQRFVGNVGWRQDEQTFDAVRADLGFGRFKLFYAYLGHVNRVLAQKKDWDSDSHLVNLTWSPAEQLRLEAFAYALDFSSSPANASITKGVKASGKTWLGLYQLAYDVTWARQSEYRHMTAPYRLDFWQADLAGTFDIYTAKVDYEWLEGNGARGFTTPLATTHAFQGWADAWVQPLGGNKSFADGLKDLNFTLNVKPRFKLPNLFNSDVIVRYHTFDDERTGAHLAHEWDAQYQASITAKLSAAIKWADFKRVDHVPLGTATPPPSRTKVWVTLEYKL